MKKTIFVKFLCQFCVCSQVSSSLTHFKHMNPSDTNSITVDNSYSKVEANILNEYFASVFTKEPNGDFCELEQRDIDEQSQIYRVCQKKKDILNIHIKSEGINIFSQKFCWTESTIFVVKCQKFTFIVQLFMT